MSSTTQLQILTPSGHDTTPVTPFGLDLIGSTDSDAAKTLLDITAGSGDVVGPESATANNIVVFADTTGKLLSDSGIAPLGLDTGWAAPQSVGAKNGVQNYIPPAFNGSDTLDITAVAALAAQVNDLTEMVQALQTALAANLRPNA